MEVYRDQDKLGIWPHIAYNLGKEIDNQTFVRWCVDCPHTHAKGLWKTLEGYVIQTVGGKQRFERGLRGDI